MNRASLFILICTTVATSACTHMTSSSIPISSRPASEAQRTVMPETQRFTIADDEIDKYIDADISPASRRVIRAAMLDQPVFARKNLIYVDRNGRIFSNHSALVNGTVLRRPVPNQNAVYDGGGRIIPLPPQIPKPAGYARALVSASSARHTMFSDPLPSAGSGPYRRLYSDSGYTYTGARVYLPCNATSINGTATTAVGPYGDAGYIYSGAYSNSGSDQGEGGFVYSADRNVYDVYLKLLKGNVGQLFNHNLSPACGQTADVAFSITPGALSVTVSLNGQNYYPLTIAEQAVDQTDWWGPGDVMKWMVTIAQKPAPQHGYEHDGYSFGVYGSPQVEIDRPTLGQCANGTSPAYAGAGFPGANAATNAQLWAQMQPNGCEGIGTENWVGQTVPDDGEVRISYGDYLYPTYNYETDGISMYNDGGDPPANGASTYQTVAEKCPTGNDPPNPQWYTNRYTTAGSATSFFTAQATNAPTTISSAITINLTNAGPDSINVQLLDRTAATMATTQVAAGSSGGITYFSPTAQSGPYQFIVSGSHSATGTPQGCVQTANNSTVDAQWTGNFNWH